MRVLILAKEGNQSETANPPTPEAMAEYPKINEELLQAGVVPWAGRVPPRWPTPPGRGEQGRSVRWQEADRHRWTVRGDQGARCRVLAMAGALDRRGPRVAQAGTIRRRDVRDPRGRRVRGH